MNQDGVDSLITQPSHALGARIGGDVAWRVVIAALALLFGAFIAVYWHAVSSAVSVWYASTAYNHGFLVLPIVGYLIWERRAALRGLSPVPYPPALLLLVPTGSAWLIANVMGITEGQQFALFGTIQALLLALLGRRIYRVLLFPFLYLIFLIPTGDVLIPYLQDFTARFIVLGLQLVGVPVYSDGVFISIPNGNFEVAEACAGLRFLTATIAFGLLFADFAYQSVARKLAFYALCIAIPILANGLRAFGIVMIAHLSNGELATGVDHIVYGWVFFSLVTFALIGLGLLFREHGGAPPPAAMQMTGSAGIGALVITALFALPLMAAPRVYAAFLDERPVQQISSRLAPPQVASPWQSAASGAAAPWHALLDGADREVAATFRHNDETVDLYIGYLDRQTLRKKLIGHQNHVVAPVPWQVAGWSSATLAIDEETIPVTLWRVVNGRTARIVVVWYWVDARFVARPLLAKLLQAKAELIDRSPGAAAIALSTELGDGAMEPALARLQDFVAHLGRLKPILDGKDQP
jgi:exosortase A